MTPRENMHLSLTVGATLAAFLLVLTISASRAAPKADLAWMLGLSQVHAASGDGACLDFSFTRGASSELPRGWEPLTFPKISRHTNYKLIETEGSKSAIRAESHASASALIREFEFDPREYPVLRWHRKVENIIKKGDETKKEGDDYAARVYVNFLYEPEKASLREKIQYGAARALYGKYPPKAAVNYIWANKLPKGKSIDNAYTSKAKMIAVESGSEKVGEWIKEERNIYEDYKTLFGEDPPKAIGVAIMTDTDDTGERAVAYYADVSLCKK